MSKVKTSPATALAEAHHALLTDIAALEPFARSGAPAASNDVLQRLEDLQAHLGKHFRFEEQNGYMQSVLTRAPQQQRVVQRLREEHDELWQTLTALLSQVKEALALSDEFRQSLQSWIQRLLDHEKRENLLVEDTFNTDMAAED